MTDPPSAKTIMKKLSFEEVIKITQQLADKITSSGYKPDYLIGIPTGGLFPLALLAKELIIKNVLSILTESTGTDEKKEVKIVAYPKIDLSNKKLLLIDEIVESGITLHQILQKLQKIYPGSEIKTATLGVNKDKCEFYPDYFIFFEEGDWVIFPWEKEDFPEYKF